MAEHSLVSILSAADARARHDNRRLRVLLPLAAVAHLAALWLVLPTQADEPDAEPERATPVQLVEYRVKPKDPPIERPKRDRRSKPIPVPDAEPLPPVEVPPELPAPDIDILQIVTLPEAPEPPPAPPAPAADPGPVRIGGTVQPPVRTRFVQPRYTEMGRRGRIEGTVILDTVIDTAGRVVDIDVLKGLPLGLTEEAVEAVSRWHFEPTSVDGRPVAVAYVVTVRFNLR